jgi:hypothetical protein
MLVHARGEDQRGRETLHHCILPERWLDSAAGLQPFERLASALDVANGTSAIEFRA